MPDCVWLCLGAGTSRCSWRLDGSDQSWTRVRWSLKKKPPLARFRDPISNYYRAGNSKQGIGTSMQWIDRRFRVSTSQHAAYNHTRIGSCTPMRSSAKFRFVSSWLSPMGNKLENKNIFRSRDQWKTRLAPPRKMHRNISFTRK